MSLLVMLGFMLLLECARHWDRQPWLSVQGRILGGDFAALTCPHGCSHSSSPCFFCVLVRVAASPAIAWSVERPGHETVLVQGCRPDAQLTSDPRMQLHGSLVCFQRLVVSLETNSVSHEIMREILPRFA